jgi:hypothetical protein
MNGRRLTVSMVIAVGFACAGCRRDASYVYVDTQRALSTESATAMPVPRAEFTALPPESTTFEIAGLPAVTEGRSTATATAKVRASIEANREKTYRTIVRRLHDAYAREADNLRAQRLAAFEPVRTKTMADAMQRISDAYVKYADAVGPKIARLAVTAGFPDPDREGRRKPSGAEGLDTLAYETSQTLRAEIAALKSEFKRYSDSTLRAAGADVDAKLTELLASVDREVGDIDAKAQDVASREVSQAQAQLGTLLSDRPPMPLPTVPGSRVVVATGDPSPPPTAPNLDSPPANGDDLSQVRRDLDIWLAVNKYVLRSKGNGRDATVEFIAWRNRFKLAPSGHPSGR